MFNRLQLVLLGVVVLQGVGLSAMDKVEKSSSFPKVINSPRTPRNPLSCSREALKRSLEVRKEENKNLINFYYDSPCGAGRVKMYEDPYSHNVSRMAPWTPDCFPH